MKVGTSGENCYINSFKFIKTLSFTGCHSSSVVNCKSSQSRPDLPVNPSLLNRIYQLIQVSYIGFTRRFPNIWIILKELRLSCAYLTPYHSLSYLQNDLLTPPILFCERLFYGNSRLKSVFSLSEI